MLKALMIEWDKLDAMLRRIYRDVRDFYDRRYSNYKQWMNRSHYSDAPDGVSEKTILEIRNELKGQTKRTLLSH
jgi:hypothetical protein